MLKFFKIALAMILLGFINIGNVFAAEYDVEGYISVIDTDYIPQGCRIGISEVPNGPTIKAGTWNCNTFDGQIMLELAEDAMVQFFQVIITFSNSPSMIMAIEAR